MNENHENKLPRFIVMDIVFKGRSLNYDQGAGNYQELKKITKFDGKQYTMISRYALRYSILETGKRMGLWSLYGNFTKESEKNVLQPVLNDLYSGELLRYPEFDLFGFMITTTKREETNQFKESPVKISHAISLTPYNYDTHMSGNHGLVKRAIESGKLSKMDINLFTREEHDAYYGYTVIIDTERIGKIELYLKKDEWDKRIKNNKDKWEEKDDKGLFRYNKNKNNEITITSDLVGNKLYRVIYEVDDNEKRERIRYLIKAILHATRSIKGSSSSLKPHLLILGTYSDGTYDTYLDRIQLDYQYEQVKETVEETIDPNDPSKGKRIIERVKVTKIPKFVVYGVDEGESVKDIAELEKEILKKLGLSDKNNKAESGNENTRSTVVYYLSDLQVELPDKKITKESSEGRI